jgi:hypothetical protein
MRGGGNPAFTPATDAGAAACGPSLKPAYVRRGHAQRGAVRDRRVGVRPSDAGWARSACARREGVRDANERRSNAVDAHALLRPARAAARWAGRTWVRRPRAARRRGRWRRRGHRRCRGRRARGSKPGYP